MTNCTIEFVSSFLTLASSSLSIFGSCLIILTFILWKDVRSSTARIIVFFLAIADLGTGLSFFVSSAGYISYYSEDDLSNNSSAYGHFCSIMSYFTTFFPVSSFFWTAYLALYFVIALVFKKPRWSGKLIILFNLTAWSIPFAICTTAIAFGILGNSDSRTSGGWCFVTFHGTGRFNKYSYDTYLWLEAVCGKGWELLFYAVVIFCYSTIYWVNRKFCCKSSNVNTNKSAYPPLIEKESDSYIRVSQRASSQAALSQAISKKLFIIPVVFVFLRVPGTYRYFLSINNYCSGLDSNDDDNFTNYCGVSRHCYTYGGNYYILPLQAFCDPLQGFGNAVLFVFFSRVIMRRLSYSIHKKFHWMKYHCTRFCIGKEVTDDAPTASLKTKNSPAIVRAQAGQPNSEYDTQLDDDEYHTSLSSVSPHMQYGSVVSDNDTITNSINQ